jgi:hypothetical protein
MDKFVLLGVMWTGEVFKFGHGEFSGVEDLLHHFTNKPLIGSESGICLSEF